MRKQMKSKGGRRKAMYSESNYWKQWFPLTFLFYSAYFRNSLRESVGIQYKGSHRDYLKDYVKHISSRSKTESLTQSLKSVWLADHWAGCLAGDLAGWRGVLVSWLPGELAGCLAGCLAGGLARVSSSEEGCEAKKKEKKLRKIMIFKNFICFSRFGTKIHQNSFVL